MTNFTGIVSLIQLTFHFIYFKAEQTPIIIVKKHEGQPSSHASHAVVLLKRNISGNLVVKNSLAGTMVFGKIQPEEHEVEFDSNINPPNQWNLAYDTCWFVKFQ